MPAGRFVSLGGPEISADKLERNDRFIEEAVELAQASNYPKERAHELVEYVYGRDQGEINQEVGEVVDEADACGHVVGFLGH